MDKYLYGGLVILAVLILAKTQYNMMQMDCAAVNVPPVRTNLIVHEPVLDKSRSVKDITAMYNGSRRHAKLPSNAFAPAVAQSGFGVKARYLSPRKMKSFTGTYCIIPGPLEIEVDLEQTVFISTGAYYDNCKFKAALDHEMKHLYVNEEVLKDNLETIEDNLENTIAYFIRKFGAGPYESRDARRAEAEYDRYIQIAVDTAIKETEIAIAKVQAVVDTPQEYRRIGKMCNWTR